MSRNWKSLTTLFVALVTTSVVVASSLIISSTSLLNNTCGGGTAPITAIEEAGRCCGAPAMVTEASESNTEVPWKITIPFSKMKLLKPSH